MYDATVRGKGCSRHMGESRRVYERRFGKRVFPSHGGIAPRVRATVREKGVIVTWGNRAVCTSDGSGKGCYRHMGKSRGVYDATGDVTKKFPRRATAARDRITTMDG